MITADRAIVSFFHCKTCLAKIPDGFSPSEWARLAVGKTDSGNIQVWCDRCNLEVALIIFKRGEPIGTT